MMGPAISSVERFSIVEVASTFSLDYRLLTFTPSKVHKLCNLVADY